jgi:hypothetical protein
MSSLHGLLLRTIVYQAFHHSSYYISHLFSCLLLVGILILISMAAQWIFQTFLTRNPQQGAARVLAVSAFGVYRWFRSFFFLFYSLILL